ncbi:MAG: carbamate kinase [Candidatus Thorarchaeota archaeon]|nr:carbamate kinase [Candidatus Thorarchaeota archaeon]
MELITTSRRAVVAIGGNSLIKDKQHQSIPDQYAAAAESCKHIADMISKGWDVVLTSGNGPQVGFIMRRSELAKHELHEVLMDYAGADTQGAIGYMLQRALHNEFKRRDIDKHAATIITQTLVDKDDPAFKNPAKPVGTFMDKDTAEKRAKKQGWEIIEDAGRGWRRVVPSPIPKEIIQQPAINALIKEGIVTYAVGGGGIPVIRNEDGTLEGVEAVIDKDRASSLLASDMGVDLLLISTAVEKAYLNFGTEDQEPIDEMTPSEAEKYIEENHFAAGSMLPKVEACVEFIKKGGDLAIITDPANITNALEGKTGTRIVPE